MFKNKLREDSSIPNFKHLKIRRRDGVESLTTLEEGEFKVPIDGCISCSKGYSEVFLHLFENSEPGIMRNMQRNRCWTEILKIKIITALLKLIHY